MFTWKGAYKMAKIAVVEDNDAMREQLCGFIAQYARESGRQLDVTAFADGAEIVDPYRPGFDIIFLDIEMPTLGGMPTAERIRQVDPDVVLVFVTNMAQYAIRGYEVDALDFVLKPVSYYQFSSCTPPPTCRAICPPRRRWMRWSARSSVVLNW